MKVGYSWECFSRNSVLKIIVVTFNLVSLLLKHEVRVIHKVFSNVLLDYFICSYFFQAVQV